MYSYELRVREKRRKQREQLKEHKLKAHERICGLNYQLTQYKKYHGMLKNLSNAEYRELLKDPALVKRLQAVLISDYKRLSKSSRVFEFNIDFSKQPLPALPPEEIDIGDEEGQSNEPIAGPSN